MILTKIVQKELKKGYGAPGYVSGSTLCVKGLDILSMIGKKTGNSIYLLYFLYGDKKKRKAGKWVTVIDVLNLYCILTIVNNSMRKTILSGVCHPHNIFIV